MRRAHEEVLDVVLVLHVHPGDADAAALLLAVGGQRKRLDVARVRDRDDHLLVGDQVLDVDLVLGVRDLGPAVVAVGVLDLEQLLADQAHHLGLVAEDVAQVLDALDDLVVLGLDLVGLQGGQALETEVEDRLRLEARQLEALDQPVARRVRVARAADQLDHLVDVRDRDQQALEDVEPRLALAELVLRAAHDHVALVVDVVADDRQQAERARHAVDQGDHVHAEGRLQLSVLVELVEDDLRVLVALELDHEPDAGLVGLVAEVRDLLDPAVLDLLDDLLHQPAAVAAAVALVDLVGHLGDDDALLAALHRLDVRACPRTTTRPRPVS